MPKLKRNTRLSKKSRDSARKRALRSHQQLSAVEDQHSTDDHQESAQGNNQLQEPAQGNNQLQEPAQGNNHLQEPAQGNNQQQESAQGNNQEAGQGNNQEAAQGNNQEPAQGESAQGINHETAQGNNQEPAQGESAQGNNQEKAQGSNQDTAKGKNQESTQGNNQESSQGDHQESATFTLEGTEQQQLHGWQIRYDVCNTHQHTHAIVQHTDVATLLWVHHRGNAVVGAPSWVHLSREARRRRAFLLVYIKNLYIYRYLAVWMHLWLYTI